MYFEFMKTKEKTMKKLTLIPIAFTTFFLMQIALPTQSVAQITCSTDIFGNTRCVDRDSGNSSTTSTDIFGNDNTTFSDGSTMQCSTDIFGNYVCN